MMHPQLSVDLAPHEQQLGKYRLVAKLGQGGMGTVYLALASGLGAFRKLLVVKELRHDLPWRESSLSMFMDEAQLAARLDHPNVLQTFEAGEADGRYFLAMEYLDGQPMSSLIDHGIPLELHVHVLCEVLQGLQYAHDLTDYDGTRLHVVHRDVSPQNVFVTHYGQVKVVDFGVAKANNGSNITSPGVFKGKFAYAAPEQLLGRPVDGRCDVFAVGVMLWEAIAGRRFGVPKPTVDAFRIRTQGLEPKISQVTPDIDPLLAEICDHALAVDPLERVESADALRTRLQEWLLLQGEHIQAKQLAAFMRDRFNDERAVRRRIIERAMVDAGASQSVVETLPRELFERESGMSRVGLELEPASQHLSASGISPSPRATAHQAAPEAPQAREGDSVGLNPAPTLSYADESVHASNPPRMSGYMKQASRVSSAAVLLLVAVGVFGLTYQLSRKATEPPTAPQLRPYAQPETGTGPATPPTPATVRPTETTSSAATASGDSQPAVEAPRQPLGNGNLAPQPAHNAPERALAPREESVERESGAREPRQATAREHSARVTALSTAAQPAAARDPNAAQHMPPPEPERAVQRTAAAAPAADTVVRDIPAAPTEYDPAKAARAHPLERAAKARTGSATRPDNNMGTDLRQMRNAGQMRIDTEDPYK